MAYLHSLACWPVNIYVLLLGCLWAQGNRIWWALAARRQWHCALRVYGWLYKNGKRTLCDISVFLVSFVRLAAGHRRLHASKLHSMCESWWYCSVLSPGLPFVKCISCVSHREHSATGYRENVFCCVKLMDGWRHIVCSSRTNAVVHSYPTD